MGPNIPDRTPLPLPEPGRYPPAMRNNTPQTAVRHLFLRTFFSFSNSHAASETALLAQGQNHRKIRYVYKKGLTKNNPAPYTRAVLTLIMMLGR
jgi:hypothetical protein